MRQSTLYMMIALLLTCTQGILFAGDTGKYEILEYRVTLNPRENGKVEVIYYQEWQVLEGHIPWITVGAANPYYTILPERGESNLESIGSANSGSWSGVRISLDRDYIAGETFAVQYSLLQEGLFSKAGNQYRFYFTPGWYERAPIGKLEVKLRFFTSLENVTSNPDPDRVEHHSYYWNKNNLQPGERFPLSLSFPKELFPSKIQLVPASHEAKKNLSRKRKMKITIFSIILIPIILLLILVIVTAARHKNGYGRGGTLGVGGNRFTHTGCVVSCACACVACACACACAGGGAAGCDRKLNHSCPLCQNPSN